MTKLTDKKCVPCEGGVPRLKPEEYLPMLKELKTAWEVVDEMKIKQIFQFDSYMTGIEFVRQVAELAEAEDHHPVMHVFFSKVEIEIWTHAIVGLSENDFILAAKIELLQGENGDSMILE